MNYLNDLALFVEVAKARSFRRAAETADVPTSTLSRRIAALEGTIGLRLLNRTTRRIELTEAGQIYFERCKRIIDEARIAHEELGDMLAHPTGTLRVSAPASEIFGPKFASIRSDSPDLPGTAEDPMDTHAEEENDLERDEPVHDAPRASSPAHEPGVVDETTLGRWRDF